MADRYSVKLQQEVLTCDTAGDNLTVQLQNDTPINISLATPMASSAAGTKNYESLQNKPSINGVTLVGSLTSADLKIISENTSAGWDADPLYIPKRGEICVYSDTNKIKIGDGEVSIIDLPYVNGGYEELMDLFHKHIYDTTVHVTDEERNFWNNKLNYDVSDEELIFTRD